MTRKTPRSRRSPSTKKPAEPPAADDSTRDEATEDQLATSADRPPTQSANGESANGGESANDGSQPAAPAISLPAFGFADDLLRGLQTAEPQAPETTDGDGDDAQVVAMQVETSGLEGPDKIFTFADRLDVGHAEKEVVKARLETWITLSLASETYALPVATVREVLRVSSVTRVPHAPEPIRGVTNLRGRVIPVIDLRRRLQLPEADISRSSRILVVGSRGRAIGLLADAVYQVAHIDRNQVQPPPEDVMTAQSDYIQGVYHFGDALILLLDVDRVLIVKEAGAA